METGVDEEKHSLTLNNYITFHKVFCNIIELCLDKWLTNQRLERLCFLFGSHKSFRIELWICSMFIVVLQTYVVVLDHKGWHSNDALRVLCRNTKEAKPACSEEEVGSFGGWTKQSYRVSRRVNPRNKSPGRGLSNWFWFSLLQEEVSKRPLASTKAKSALPLRETKRETLRFHDRC